jgi:hypothetical protein
VPSTVRPSLDSAHTLFHAARSDEIHNSSETVLTGKLCLLKCHLAAKCRFERKAPSRGNVIENPSLKFYVDLGTDSFWDSVKGTCI